MIDKEKINFYIGKWKISPIREHIVNAEKYYKLIPVVLAICGGVLGVIIYLTNKEMIFNVDNIYLAIEVGIVSGTSSTGTNQIIKKIFKQGGKENE